MRDGYGGCGADDYDARGVLRGGGGGEKGCEQARKIENSPDIQIQHLLAGPIRCRFEWSSPRCSCIAYQDIQFSIRLFPNLFYKALDILGVGGICGNSDGLALDVEFVELLDSLIDALISFGLARRDKDFGGTGEEECGCGVESDAAGTWI